MLRFGLLLAVAVLLTAAAAAQEAMRPRRVVSLNLCTDELLLRLAAPEQIASVTWLSHDPRNTTVAKDAKRIPANHGLAEEVLAFSPDLVVAGRYTTRVAVALLKRTGVRVVEFGVPQSLLEAEEQIREFAELVGYPERGEALNTQLRSAPALDDQAPGGRRPRAIVLRPNGFTAARSSLADDLMKRAGLDNLAARLDLGHYGQVPLETVLLEDADVLITDDGRTDHPALATAILEHPALRAREGRLVRASISSRLWSCAGPGMSEAIRRLGEAGRQALSHRP